MVTSPTHSWVVVRKTVVSGGNAGKGEVGKLLISDCAGEACSELTDGVSAAAACGRNGVGSARGGKDHAGSGDD
jgi:hypothetical protein